MSDLSDREKSAIRHALGFSTDGMAYRNYFNADDGGEDFKMWKGLEARGLAISWKTKLTPGGTYFAASGHAALLVRGPDEHFDRETAAGLRRIDAAIASKKG